MLAVPAPVDSSEAQADLERRFGGLRRLYGDVGYQRLRAARVAVVGLGGVGSWTVEALARSGVAALLLIDLDHVSESNINRQLQATTATLGQHKGDALRERVAAIHPACEVQVVDEFVTADTWPGLQPMLAGVHALVDACDDVRAKRLLAAHGLATRLPLVSVGAAGGKRRAQDVEVADLAEVTHDPLLAGLRQRLRKDGLAPRARPGAVARIGLRCVYSRESVTSPLDAACDVASVDDVASAGNDGSLNCHGYGSSVVVTATFGMVAAGEVVAQLLASGAGRGR